MPSVFYPGCAAPTRGTERESTMFSAESENMTTSLMFCMPLSYVPVFSLLVIMDPSFPAYP